jgi:CSLREA domain-containing protein
MRKAFLILCACVFLTQTALGATYTVSKVADTNDGTCDADCSLREAVVAANGTPDNDIVTFSNAVFNTAQTITLTLGTDIIINNAGTLTITGPTTSALTVAGSGSRIFTNNTAAVTVISNLRLTGGNGASTIQTGRGGAVYNNGGTLTLSSVVITGNTAANGGGFNNAGTATINLLNSTVSNNTATGAGGGAQNFSGNTLNIIGSTFSGNTCNSTITGGGAIQANGTVNIANSTFSGNNAQGGDGGALYYNGQGLALNNVTIAGNTSSTGAGGLHKATATLNANVRNTIIAGNTVAGTNIDAFGAISSQGNNLVQAIGSSTGWVASDILGQDPQLIALANNGGATQTRALQSNSPAINAGQNCVVTASCAAGNPSTALATDQRGAGFPRQVGAAVDIGAFEFSGTVTPPAPAEFDFDGDGRTDYGVYRPSNNTWLIQRSSDGFFGVPFGLPTDRLVPEDFDGDSRTDVAVWREGAQAFFYILQSATNTFISYQIGQTGDDPGITGNWDNDGRADPAVYRAGAQSQFIYRGSFNNQGGALTSIPWGTTGDAAVRGNFDGDFRLDAAVFRPSANAWYIRQSSNGAFTAINWGLATDKRVPADYDGDGRTDAAIFRDGLWAVLQSSNGQARFVSWGTASDRLVPGDYTGDGQSDFAVWRNGTFFVLPSSGGSQFTSFQFGASTDIPVASAFVQ